MWRYRSCSIPTAQTNSTSIINIHNQNAAFIRQGCKASPHFSRIYYADMLSFLTCPACSSAWALLLAKTFWLRSKTGSVQGTPVDAQTVMMARYLCTRVSDRGASRGMTRHSPSHDCRDKTKASADFHETSRQVQPVGGGISSNLVVGRRKEAEENNQGKEEDDVGDVGAERA